MPEDLERLCLEHGRTLPHHDLRVSDVALAQGPARILACRDLHAGTRAGSNARDPVVVHAWPGTVSRLMQANALS